MEFINPLPILFSFNIVSLEQLLAEIKHEPLLLQHNKMSNSGSLLLSNSEFIQNKAKFCSSNTNNKGYFFN